MSVSRRNIMIGGAAAVGGQISLLSGTRGQAIEKLNWGYLPVNVNLAPYVSAYNPFVTEGVDPQLVRTAGGPAILQLMLTGDLQVGEAATAPAIIAATKGLPLYFLTIAAVATPRAPLDRIMVLRDSPIKTFQDLRGRTLAINQLGTMPDAILGASEKVMGVKKSDIKIVPIPYPNMPQVLAQKQVDAIYPFPPFDTVAEVTFNARTLTETTDLVPYVGYTMLGVRRNFADENPDTVSRIVRGSIKMQRWIADNNPTAKKTASAALGVTGEIADRVRMPYFLANALPSLPNLWHMYYLLLAGKVIDPVDDPEKMFDEYFVKPVERFTLPAAQTLGLRPDPVAIEMRSAQYPLLPKPTSSYFASWERG